MEGEVLVKVERVSKKFAKDLKKSLKYGLQDIMREVLGKSRKKDLRPSEFLAVNDVSFEVKRGECLGLIGHNGAGKSTLLKMLNGLIKPDQGRIEIRGRVAALIELGAGFNPILTGRENIYNNASVLGFTKKETDEKLEEIIEFSELRDFIDAPVQSYSSGMKVRLGFAIAAQMEPDVLIIDEVLAVGDIGFRIKCLNRISELLEKSAIIFVTHSMPQVSRVCTDGLLLNRGSVMLATKDVSSLIVQYYNLFSTENERILGGENLEVMEREIEFNGDEAGEIISQGENLKISVRVKWKRPVNKIFCKFFFINKETRNVLDCASELNYGGLDIEGDESIICAKTKPLFLNGGKYTLTMVIVNAENFDRLYRHDGLFEINVKSTYFSWSDNVVEAEWETKKA